MRTVISFIAALALWPALTMAQPVMISTQTFRAMAASSDQLEIQSSRLALERSRSPAVRQFARQMIRDHTRTTAALMGGTPVLFEPDLTSRHTAMLIQIADARGAAFDRLYKRMQVQSHREAIALYTTYARNGDDPSHVRFAESTLPHLRMHLAMARSLPNE